MWNFKILNLRSKLKILEEISFKLEFAADLKIQLGGINVVDNLNFDTGFIAKKSLRLLGHVTCKDLSTL